MGKKKTAPKKAAAPKKASKPRTRSAPIAPPPPGPPPNVELLDHDRKPAGLRYYVSPGRLIEVRHGDVVRTYDHVATRDDGIRQYMPSDRLTG